MKKLILIILILFTCGCEVEYTVSIGDVYDENVKFYYDEDYGVEEDPTNILSYSYDVGYSETNDLVEGFSYYEITNYSGYIKYSYTFSKEDYKYSNIASYCYKIYTEENEDSTKIYTNNVNSCFAFYDNLEKITINIIDDNNEFVSTNASSSSNNVYTWIFYETERYDSYIEIIINETAVVEPEEDVYDDNEYEYDSSVNYDDEEENTDSTVYIVVTLFFLIFLGVIVFRVKKSSVK